MGALSTPGGPYPMWAGRGGYYDFKPVPVGPSENMAKGYLLANHVKCGNPPTYSYWLQFNRWVGNNGVIFVYFAGRQKSTSANQIELRKPIIQSKP